MDIGGYDEPELVEYGETSRGSLAETQSTRLAIMEASASGRARREGLLDEIDLCDEVFMIRKAFICTGYRRTKTTELPGQRRKSQSLKEHGNAMMVYRRTMCNNG